MRFAFLPMRLAFCAFCVFGTLRFTFCVFTVLLPLPFLVVNNEVCVFARKCVFYRCNAFKLVLLHLKSYAHFIHKLYTPNGEPRFARRAHTAALFRNSFIYSRIISGRLFAHFRTCSVVPLRHLNEPTLHSVASAKTRKCYALVNKNTYCKKMKLYYKM